MVIFDSETPFELIELIQPDVLVKGGDYIGKQVIGQDIVKEVTDALTDKYTLANWKSKDIYLPEEKKTIFTLVRETTMRMKYVHVERKLHALKDYLKMESADYDYYMVQFQKWNSARQMINEKLNRVV